MSVENRIKELKIEIPEMSKPMAMYIPTVRDGNTLYVSGQGPFADGMPKFTGKAGNVSMAYAQDAARLCVANMLAAIKYEVGNLEAVKRFANITVYVNSAPGFQLQHIVANAASQMLFDIFGESGRHTRTAVGVNELGLDITVEVSATVILHDE